jgi:putative transposon-encoded protein
MTTFTIEGEQLIKKTVSDGGTSGRTYVPNKWVGREVAIVLLEGRQ